MKKILILSAYFPPCNLTPSERVYSFARYFNEFGFYPVIVTRNWDQPIHHASDEYKPAGKTVKHEVHENYEVYYLPYRPTLRDKLFLRFSGKKGYIFYKAAAFAYSIGENFSSAFTAYNPLYRQCRKLLGADSSIQWLLVTAYPFHLFKYGYLLHKEFGTNWIADYRDDWNTNELVKEDAVKKLVQKFSAASEIKWVRSAKFFTSVSDHYVQKLQRFLRTVPGHTILNGYMEENYAAAADVNSDHLQITYVGSLYPTQPIEIFLSGVKKFITERPQAQLKVNFLGLKAQPAALSRVEGQIAGFEKYFHFTFRLPKKEAIARQAESNILLACAHKDLKGTPGSKIYEFIALKKPVIICPSDREIIENTLTDTGQGHVADSANDCCDLLHHFYSEFEATGGVKASGFKEERAKMYSRKGQVKKLAEIISSYQNKHALKKELVEE